MADPHRRRPPAQVVREGNPGKRPVREGVKLPPAELVEPKWMETFPPVFGDKGQTEVNRRAREVASTEWRRVVPVLAKTAGLAEVDATALRDYCVCVARLDQCERDLSRNGLLMVGERGWQKNGATTIAAQYRTMLKTYLREFGLSPSARAGLAPPPDGDDDGDDAFD